MFCPLNPMKDRPVSKPAPPPPRSEYMFLCYSWFKLCVNNGFLLS